MALFEKPEAKCSHCKELEERLISVMRVHEELLGEKVVQEMRYLDLAASHDKIIQRNVDYSLRVENEKSLHSKIEKQAGEIEALRNLLIEKVRING